MAANNIVLKGQFSGDTIHEASELCKWCERLVEEIVAIEKPDGSTKQTK